MQTTVQTDWPLRLQRAVRAAQSQAERDRLVSEVLLILRRTDPLGLRDQGLDAGRREARYAEQVRQLVRAAA